MGLGMIKDKRAVEAIRKALKDEDYFVRDRAAEALGKLAGKDAVKLLIQSMKDKCMGVNRGAVSALWEIGSDAVESLIKTLKDEDSDVRLGAVEALAKIRDKRAVRPLFEALEDENEYVRKRASDALEEILGPKWKYFEYL